MAKDFKIPQMCATNQQKNCVNHVQKFLNELEKLGEEDNQSQKAANKIFIPKTVRPINRLFSKERRSALGKFL